VKNPVTEPNALSVRALAKTADEAGLPVGRLLEREHLPQLRKRIKSGSAASAFETLQILCNLYLENCRPQEWEPNAIDARQATMVEKYVTRLSFMHLLTGDPRHAELARRIVMRVLSTATPDACALAHDWLAHYLTDDEKAKLADAAPAGDDVITCANCPEVLTILGKEAVGLQERERQDGSSQLGLKLTPFDHCAPSPIRSELVGQHPRILLTPQQIGWIRAKAEAVPGHIWRPPSIRPRYPPAPRRDGNSGGPAGWLPGICLAYWTTGEDVYLEQGKMIMRRLCEYRRWGGHNHLPADIDLDAGHLLTGIGIGYDLLYHGMMPSERAFIRRKLVRQARKMYRAHGHKDKYAYDQNHTYIDNGGLWVTAVALYDEVPEAKEWYDFGTRIIKKGLHCCNAGDGGFYEGVAYWGYGGGNLLRLLYLFENVTGENVFEHYDCFKKTKHFLAHTTLPDWRHIVNMWDAGDAPTYRRSFSNHWEAMLLAANKYRDAEAQGLAELFHRHGRLKPSTDAWPLLWWEPTVAPTNPLDKWAPYHYFDDFDLVCIRSSWQTDAVHFALRCGPPLGRRVTEQVLLRNEMPEWTPGTGHVHPDINAFIIFNRGEHLAVDTGYTLRKCTKDHNTIAVDGGGQIGEGQAWPRYQPWDRYGKIGEFFAAPGCYYYVRGEAARAYQPELELTQFDRHVIFIDPDYFLIFDELASTKPHTYEWLCHSIDKPQAGPDNRFVIRRGKQALVGYTLLPQPPTMTTEDAVVEPTPWRPEATHRGTRVRVGGPNRQREAQFLTVLALQDGGSEQPSVELVRSGTALGAIIARSGARDTVLLAGQAAGVETDAARCFVRTSHDRQPARWAMHQGTRLAINGQTLVASDRPLTCAWRVVRGENGELVRQVGYLETATKAEVAVLAPRAPVRVTGARGTFDRARQVVRLEVEAGRREIQIE